MHVTAPQVERVYDFIWSYLTEREELPTARQVASALDIQQEDVQRYIRHLRAGHRWNMPEVSTDIFRSRKVT